MALPDLKFDTIFPETLTGHLDEPQVIDADATPNRTLAIAMPYTVKLDWKVTGSNACCLGGTWKVKISLESLGEGFEGKVWEGTKAYTDVEAGSASNKQMWHVDAAITNPTTDPNPDKNVTPGVYMLVVLILYTDLHGQEAAMAAFSRGVTLAFYNPGY